MELAFITVHSWDEALWDKVKDIYHEAFPHGAKPDKLLQSIVQQGIAALHAGFLGDEAVAMAITGFTGPENEPRLVIDYMAIRQDSRGQGLGRHFFELIRSWALHEQDIRAIMIEAEAEDNPVNRGRLRFWEHCGFIPTSYVQQYIWVPEPYRALVLPLTPDFRVTDDGQSLFRDIISFHEKAYRKR